MSDLYHWTRLRAWAEGWERSLLRSRRTWGAVVATVALACAAGLTLASGVAEAAPSQVDVTPTCPSSDYPPGTVESSTEIEVTAARFTPGGQGSLTLANTIPNHSYEGTIFSTPIAVGPASSDAAGNLTFTFAVPADFELGQAHTMTLTCDDVLSATLQMCISSTGALTQLSVCGGSPASASPGSGSAGGRGGSLARTGLSYLLLLLRVALVLLACGALFVYVQRRRTTPQRL